MSKIAYKKLGALISWADYSKSQARGYLAAGWTFINLSKPDYFYIDKSGKCISKQARMKKKMKTLIGMTEKQHAEQDGLIRVWDCGKILLKYEINQ